MHLVNEVDRDRMVMVGLPLLDVRFHGKACTSSERQPYDNYAKAVRLSQKLCLRTIFFFLSNLASSAARSVRDFRAGIVRVHVYVYRLTILSKLS